MKKEIHSAEKIHEVIGLAWADEVSFDAIKEVIGLTEKQVIALMRTNLKPRSFKVWRARVSGRKAKHQTRLTPIRQTGSQSFFRAAINRSPAG
jgi:uncharacterized protein (TIGR03643 family)